MAQQIIIAIDGFSSCGKSTLAKALAKALNYTYIDSGAMYRAVTLHFLRHQVDIADEQAIAEALQAIHIRFDASNHTLLRGENVEKEIREMRVSNWVSEVSALSQVRRAMVHQQQEMGQGKGIVMDGRDIGTVVFPGAELKIFLTASPEVRAQRRYQEYLQKGIPISMEEVASNLTKRDEIDSTRSDSPLRQAEDAVVIDNTHLAPAEQLDLALALVQERMG
ncbi:MAG TPA: (d)CMP kinase [Saprospiraceae bacterium]|nr:(d)CMP kinase [Saprospiraceae bacterium]HMQ83728.1 (d)CMP kinase [Saprospiraceae bacterium]